MSEASAPADVNGRDAERSAWLVEQRDVRGRPIGTCMICGFDDVSDLGHTDAAGFVCMYCWDAEEDRRIAAALTGKTILRADRWRATDDGWNTRSTWTLFFTDGTKSSVEGWGYDAWGVDIAMPEPALPTDSEPRA